MEPDKLLWADRFTALMCAELGGYSTLVEWAIVTWLEEHANGAADWKNFTPEQAVQHELKSWDNQYYFTQGGKR